MDVQRQLVDGVVEDLGTIYLRLQELNVPTWLRLDLTMAQFRALVLVSHQRGITVGEVGARLSIGQSAASLLVDHLVRRGLVARTEDPADRRRSLLACTPAGEALLDELRHGKGQALREWLAWLSDDELQGMAHGLHIMAAAARAPRRDEQIATNEAAS
jgi:DNA-binding MarR family transcriptional regulator